MSFGDRVEALCDWFGCIRPDGHSAGILRKDTVYKNTTSQKIKSPSQAEFQSKYIKNDTEQAYSNQAGIQYP